MRILRWLGLALATLLTVVVVVAYAYAAALFLTDCTLNLSYDENVDLPPCVDVGDTGIELCIPRPKDAGGQ